MNQGPGSSVGIATELQAGRSGIEFRWGEIFRHPEGSLWPTQPHVQWVLVLSRGVKYGRGVLLTTHPRLVPWSWKSRAMSLPTLWATPRPVTRTLHYMLFLNQICLHVFVRKFGWGFKSLFTSCLYLGPLHIFFFNYPLIIRNGG